MKKFFLVVTVLLLVMLCQIVLMADCPVSGTYQSDWGTVFLSEQSGIVTGTWQQGTVTGVRNGNTIHYTWYQGNVMGGKGVWSVSPDCNSLNGPWGTGENETGGGYWNLQR
jgi:hypothetical protein